MDKELEPRQVQPRLPGLEGSSVYVTHAGIDHPTRKESIKPSEVEEVAPRDKDYGGYTPEERAELEQDLEYWQK